MQLQRRFPMCAVFLLLALAPPAVAQTGAIDGSVTEASTGEPVAGAVIEATVSGDDARRSVMSDDRGRFRIDELRPGPYTVSVKTYQYHGVHRDVDVAAGQTTTVHVELTARVFAGEAIVVSASRERETLWEAPAAVAVVDSVALAARPAVTPSDHLAAVPGVDQIRYGLQSANVVTRGFNNLFSGALHTLTDYRIASVPSLRVNLLHLEPTANEDLEHMEVVLGPGAALYGPNTANGVLHILTRSPLDDVGTKVSVTTGERDVLQGSFRTAGRLGETFGVKLSGQVFDGREWPFTDPVEALAREAAAADPAACMATWRSGGVADAEAALRCERVGDRSFDMSRWTLDARADWRPGGEWSTVLSAGVARADGIELTGIGAAQAVGWTKYHYQARASRGRLFGQVYLNGSDAGDTYLLQNGASIHDRSKLFVTQLQHGFEAGDRQSFTYGLDYLLTMPETDGSINGRNEDDDRLSQVGGFLQSETAVTEALDFIVAGRLDHTSALDDVVFSPRAGLVYIPAPGHSLRATYNRAVETPTSLNMFLDIHAGGVPDSSLAALGYGMRAQGPGFDGIDLVGADGLPPGMRSPFNPGGAGQLLPADAPTLWALAVGVLHAQGVIDDAMAAELAQLDASALAINALDPNTRALTALEDAGVSDITRVRESRQSTFELGYKGLLFGERLMFAVDAWHTEKSEFVSPLMPQTPFLLLEGTSTVGMLVPYFMGKGMTQEQAVDAARRLVVGDPAVTGDGAAEIPLAVASSPGVNAVGADMLLSYRNFGRVRLWGADVSATLLLGRSWSLGLTGSWVSDDHFRIPLQGTEQILALNAPTLKGSASLRFRDPGSGFNAEGRVRHHNEFPANSAGYVGLECVGVAGSAQCVEGATLADLLVGYELPGIRGASIQLSVQNVFDTPYRAFVRVPEMGRLALLRLSYEF